MSIKISIPGASFSAANVAQRTSFNSVRTGLAFEFVPGLTSKLSVKNMVSGGADGAIFGYPAYNANSMKTGSAKGMLMPVASSAEETLVIVMEKIAGQNLGLNSFNDAQYRELGCHAGQLVVAGGGGNRIVQSIATHALNVPYFAAATFSAATGTYKLFWGKAGTLNASAAVVGGAIPATVPTRQLAIGNPVGTGYVDDDNIYYAAGYSSIISDANILQMYLDARDRYLASNADF